MKFAFVSETLPPSTSSGLAVIIHRMLVALPPENYCLVSGVDYDDPSYQGAPDRLPARYYFVPPRFPRRPAARRRGLFLAGWEAGGARDLLSLVWRAKQIADVLKRERCEAVVVTTDSLINLPAARVAARLVRTPFFAYLFEDYLTKWVEPWYGPKARAFARTVEPLVLKTAAGVICENDVLRDELHRRYGVGATLIPNPCDLSRYDDDSTPNPSFTDGEVRIVYTGAVYNINRRALRNLVAALGLIRGVRARLHLYTNCSASELSAYGLEGPVVLHGYVPTADMPRIQRQAHVLFLPLDFDTPYDALLRTATPGKMGEYLASRRPILVHAPPDSFISRYFVQHRCGVVVEQDDPRKLAEAIERVGGDGDLREKVAANAWKRAREDFDLKRAQTRFAELLGVHQQEPGGLGRPTFDIPSE